jgi:hypothetical protein
MAHADQTDALIAVLREITLAYKAEGSREERLALIETLLENRGRKDKWLLPASASCCSSLSKPAFLLAHKGVHRLEVVELESVGKPGLAADAVQNSARLLVKEWDDHKRRRTFFRLSIAFGVLTIFINYGRSLVSVDMMD